MESSRCGISEEVMLPIRLEDMLGSSQLFVSSKLLDLVTRPALHQKTKENNGEKAVLREMKRWKT